MQIVEIAPVTAANPFAADIAQLAEMTAANPLAAGVFEVPSAEVGKTKFKIGKAANAIDLTAALVSEEPGKGDLVKLTFRLKARHQSGPRKPRNAEEVAEAETEETTAE